MSAPDPCDTPVQQPTNAGLESKGATPITHELNPAAPAALPASDTRADGDARRGFLRTLPDVEIKNEEGPVVWTLRDYTFLREELAPPTVNPSLWRQAQLNMNHGLFRVTDRIYQIRGFDLSNMPIIEGDDGNIVIDPLISTEVARASLELYRNHRGQRPVIVAAPTLSLGVGDGDQTQQRAELIERLHTPRARVDAGHRRAEGVVDALGDRRGGCTVLQSQRDQRGA